MRRSFDSACRLAGFTPNYILECRSPQALLAMAEAGHGVAIIPSALRIHRYVLRLLRVVYRGKPLSEPLNMVYDKRRPLPAYAKVFCDMLAVHAKKVFPTKPPSVEYSMTPLGRSLYLPLSQVINWALDHHDAVKQARVTFDTTA